MEHHRTLRNLLETNRTPQNLIERYRTSRKVTEYARRTQNTGLVSKRKLIEVVGKSRNTMEGHGNSWNVPWHSQVHNYIRNSTSGLREGIAFPPSDFAPFRFSPSTYPFVITHSPNSSPFTFLTPTLTPLTWVAWLIHTYQIPISVLINLTSVWLLVQALDFQTLFPVELQHPDLCWAKDVIPLGRECWDTDSVLRSQLVTLQQPCASVIKLVILTNPFQTRPHLY